MSSMLRNARIGAAQNGTNESRAIKTNEGLEELFNRKQALIAEMNNAKVKAIREAVKPFEDELHSIDQQYGMLISMIGNNLEDSE